MLLFQVLTFTFRLWLSDAFSYINTILIKRSNNIKKDESELIKINSFQ